jgi:hypothetical protein
MQSSRSSLARIPDIGSIISQAGEGEGEGGSAPPLQSREHAFMARDVLGFGTGGGAAGQTSPIEQGCSCGTSQYRI